MASGAGTEVAGTEGEQSMAKLAFLGLGLMGTPMATRLLDAGHDLTVWNRSPGRTKALADRGASVAPTPAQAASKQPRTAPATWTTPR
jgi:6-phosphogluconate dehydrogenase (decarboxylating)